MQVASEQRRRRRFWFIPRFGVRSVLLLMLLVVVVVGPWANRTRRQIKACEYFRSKSIPFEIGKPLPWLNFLPQSWLQAGGGHWCCPVLRVQLKVPNGIQDYQTLQANLKQVGNLPRLHEVDLALLPRVDEQTNMVELFSPLANVSDLYILQIGSCGDMDRVLTSLPHLSALKQLTLSADDSLTDVGLDQLGKFPRLESLTFVSSFVSGRSLKTIASLPRLKEFVASYCKFGSNDIQCFANHPSLERFETSSMLSDDIFKVFGTCPRLKLIDATRSLISDQGLSYLANLKDLEDIWMDSTSISEQGLAHLAKCVSLKSIHCRHCKLTDTVSQTLSQLPNLEYVDLRGTLVTNKILAVAHNMKQLKEIHVDSSIATMKDVLDLAAAAPQLQWGEYEEWCDIYNQFSGRASPASAQNEKLNLSYIKGLAGRVHQAKNFGSIKAVFLNGSDANDQDIGDLVKRNSSITEVHIKHTPVTIKGLKSLTQLGKLLNLEAGPFDNDAESLAVLASIQGISRLQLAGLKELTQQSKDAFLTLTGIKSLVFDDLAYDKEFAEQICTLPLLNEIRWADRYWNVSQIEQLRAKVVLSDPKLNRKLSPLSSYSPSEIVVDSELAQESLKEGLLNYVEFSGFTLSNHSIEMINQMKKCVSLNLGGSGLTDELLQAIEPRPELHALDLSNNRITDASIDALLRFEHIATLKLANTEITDVGLSRLLCSFRFESLDASGLKITQKSFDNYLADYFDAPNARKNLEWIGLQRVDAMPTIVNNLKKLGPKNLPSEVSLSADCALHANALAVLLGLRPSNALTDLCITRELLDVWPASDLVAGKDCLRTLEIHKTGGVADILRVASQSCPALHTVVIAGEHLDVATVKELPPQTRRLTIRSCVCSTEVLDSIAQTCPQLLTLDLLSPMEGCSLSPLLKMSRLKDITVNPTELSADQLAVTEQLVANVTSKFIND